MRPATSRDAAAIREVVVDAGMFTAPEAAFVPSLLEEVLSQEDPLRGVVVDVDEKGSVVGVALWQPVEVADGVTDLTMIAVAPAVQGRGRGRALLACAEDASRSAGQRLMVVQTSGTEQYAGARRFYAALGPEPRSCVPGVRGEARRHPGPRPARRERPGRRRGRSGRRTAGCRGRSPAPGRGPRS